MRMTTERLLWKQFRENTAVTSEFSTNSCLLPRISCVVLRLHDGRCQVDSNLPMEQQRLFSQSSTE